MRASQDCIVGHISRVSQMVSIALSFYIKIVLEYVGRFLFRPIRKTPWRNLSSRKLDIYGNFRTVLVFPRSGRKDMASPKRGSRFEIKCYTGETFRM